MGRAGGFGGGRGGRSGGFGGSTGGRSSGFGGQIGRGKKGHGPYHSPRPPRYRPRPMGVPFPMRPPIFNAGKLDSKKQSSPSNHSDKKPPSGCGTAIITIALIAVCFYFLFSFFNTDPAITPSSKERQALSHVRLIKTSYITDRAHWINDKNIARQSLEYFYQQTGVQPHLLILEDINGEKTQDKEKIMAYAEQFYDQHFKDEAHLLLLFYEPQAGQYLTYYLAGQQAKTVIDDEAGQILLDTLDHNYHDSNLSDEEYFSQSFKQVADRIMTVSKPIWPWLITGSVIAIIVYLLYKYWRRRQILKQKRQKETEEMLKRPLETFG